MKTNLEILNEISVKLEGQGNATSITEALNNIANALGDDNPDKIISVSNSLEDILSVAGEGGGGGISVNPILTVNIVNNRSDNLSLLDGRYQLNEYGNVAYEESTVLPLGNSTINELIMDEGSGYVSRPYTVMNPDFSRYNPVITNLVNCTVDEGGGALIITDSSAPASATLTYESGE